MATIIPTTYPTSIEEDLHSKQGGHRLSDHSFFPDAIILCVRRHNFFVSASYLALHSHYFHNLFYGSGSTGLDGVYELDVDPHIFGDLLDMVYPSYKKIICCSDCSSSLENRLNLALQLKLRFAVKRLVMDSAKTYKRDAVARILLENNVWSNFSIFFGNYTHHDHVNVKENMSGSLDPVPVTDKFPDATTVIVRGVTFLVSASTLSLCSTVLSEKLYDDGNKLSGVTIDLDISSFTAFLQATIGDFPSEMTVKFLDDLLALGATKPYDFYVSEIKKQMTFMTREAVSNSAKLLFEHYANHAKVNHMKSIMHSIDRNEVMDVVSKSNKLSQELKSLLKNTFEDAEKKPCKIFVKLANGPTITFNLPNGTCTRVIDIKQLILKKEGFPVKWQTLLSHQTGCELKDGLMLKDCGVKAEGIAHFIYRGPPGQFIPPDNLYITF